MHGHRFCAYDIFIYFYIKVIGFLNSYDLFLFLAYSFVKKLGRDLIYRARKTPGGG